MSGPPDRGPVSSGASAPPPRRPGGAASGPVATATAARVVVGPAAAADADGAATPSTPGRTRRGRSGTPAARSPRARAPWWLRCVAWVVAVPVGLVLVGLPARRLGYLDSQKLLDVLIGEGSGRFLPLVVIVLLWALVTAVLVQVIVEGGHWWLRRRRRSAAAGAAADPVSARARRAP